MDFKAGMKVAFIDAEAHIRAEDYYPIVGTIGEIFSVDDEGLLVQWPQNSTNGDFRWWCSKEQVIPASVNIDGCAWCEVKSGNFKLSRLMFYLRDGNELFEEHLPLVYCPVCGRKLFEINE